MLVAMFNFALPSAHMAMLSAQTNALVLCSGSGIQLVVTHGDDQSDTPVSQLVFQSCPLCAHGVTASLPLLVLPALQQLAFTPVQAGIAVTTPPLLAQPRLRPPGRGPPLA
ncbi:DUF2946 family protein [Silvimonas terrae]